MKKNHPPDGKDQSEIVKKIISLAGNQQKLANLINVKRCTISAWVNRNKKVPSQHVLAIETALKNKISRHEIRPDLYPLGGMRVRRAG